MSAEHRNSQDVLRTARLFTDGESLEQIQARLDKSRVLHGVTPRSSGYKETRKTRQWWVRAFEQILKERAGVSTFSQSTTNEIRSGGVSAVEETEERYCGRCGGSGSIGGRHLAGLAEQAADQFGDAGKIDCPTCGGSGRIY
jgi:DnaJ-class molecular chaperone